MKNTVILVLLLLALSSVNAVAQNQDSRKISVAVAECNMFPNPDLKSGDVLYGLFSSNIGYLLLPVKIGVTQGVDDRCNKFTRVDMDYPETPVFMIKGIPDLKTGLIKTAFSGKKFIYPGESVSISMRDDEKGRLEKRPRSLSAFGDVREDGNLTLLTNYKVELQDGNDRQVLDFYRNSTPRGRGVLTLSNNSITPGSTTGMDSPTLMWAGDLDADDKIDAFMWWPCPGKGAGVYSLFLSSLAKNGDLVAKMPVGVRTYSLENE
jgi:hypothetical protein